MSNIIKNMGNINQFGKEEFYNIISVLGIGYFGSCITLLANLPDNSLDTLLPDDIHKPPYVSNETPQGVFNKFFSYKSDFPHHIVSGMDFLDEYFLFYGGISSYVYSSYRFLLKYIIKSIDTKNLLVDAFAFYLLPIIVTYFVLFPFALPLISLMLSIIPCFYQESMGINALFISFACITNWFDGELINNLFDLTQFPLSFVFYICNGWFGIFISFFLFVIIGFTSVFSWFYMISLWFLMPIYLKLILNMSFDELGKTISTELHNHIFGLITLFLIYTMMSAYKFLNSKVALGILIGSMSIILIMLYSMVKTSFELGFFHGIMQLFSKLNLGPTIFWILVIWIIIYKYTSTQSSINSIY